MGVRHTTSCYKNGRDEGISDLRILEGVHTVGRLEKSVPLWKVVWRVTSAEAAPELVGCRCSGPLAANYSQR